MGLSSLTSAIYYFIEMVFFFVFNYLKCSDTYHSVLFTASPNPGVSTMVSFSLTPFSSMSTVCLVISTVCVIRSRKRMQTHHALIYQYL